MDGAQLDDKRLGDELARADLFPGTAADQPFGAPMPRAFRLADAERIAASRLEGAAEGSLKEALATMIVAQTPTGTRLTERLQQIAAASHLPSAPDLAQMHAAPLHDDPGLPETAPFHTDALPEPEPLEAHLSEPASEASFGWMYAVPPAHAVPFFEDREADADWMHEAAVRTPVQEVVAAPAPSPDTALDSTDSTQQPFLPDVVISTAEAFADAPAPDVFAAEIMPESMPELYRLNSEGGSEGDVEGTSTGELEAEQDPNAATHFAFTDTPETHHTDPGGAQPGFLLSDDPDLEPIMSAYAANARLAADAAAASQALFELQKILNEQLVEAPPERDEAIEAHDLAGLAAVPAEGQGPEPTRSPEAAGEAQVEAHSEAQVEPRVEARIEDGSEIAEPTATEALMAALGAPAAASALAHLPPPLPGARLAWADAMHPILNDVPHEDLPKCMVGPERAPAMEAAALNPAPATPPARAIVSVSTARGEVARVVPASARLPAPPPAPRRRQRAAFDVRGFAAGFALSGAIGLLLYFVMSTS